MDLSSGIPVCNIIVDEEVGMTTQDQVGILTQTNKPASKTNARGGGRKGGRKVGGGREMVTQWQNHYTNVWMKN